MSDNINVLPSTGGGVVPVALENIVGLPDGTTAYVCLNKIGFGPANGYTAVTSSTGLPVAIVGTPTVNAAQSGSWSVTVGAAIPAGGNVIGGVTQSGTWTVTANAGTGTFAVSAASLPLPTGAATAAKQPALGTAGTPSTDVITVQGATSMTALKVDGSGVTQPVSGTVTVNALPAGTNLIGEVAAGQRIDAAFNGATALTPLYAAITASSSGENAIVAGVASKKITVLKWSIWFSGAVNITWEDFDGTSTYTPISGLITGAAAGQPASGAYCPVGHFQTQSGHGLYLNLSGAVAVGGYVVYTQG